MIENEPNEPIDSTQQIICANAYAYVSIVCLYAYVYLACDMSENMAKHCS